jgi:hypothetical protein
MSINNSGKTFSGLENNRPIVPTLTHPVETGSYIIPTPEINRMFKAIKKWLSNRSPGGIIYGRPRLGKTRALKFIISHLPAIFGDELAIFSARCKRHSLPNESIFYQELLTDFKHGFSNSGKASDKRDRITNLFIEKGERGGLNKIVLFLDEANRLSSIHYDWLMDIYNDLDAAGITMTVISVGQLELINMRSSFFAQKKSQIIGRFMASEHKFEGIKSAAEIKICLNGYDTAEDLSNCPYTKFFFPEEYVREKRLSDFADGLYSIFSEIRKEHGLTKKFDIPMQYLTSSVEYVLIHYGINGEGVSWPTLAQWKMAVQESGYWDSEVLMGVIADTVG